MTDLHSGHMMGVDNSVNAVTFGGAWRLGSMEYDSVIYNAAVKKTLD